MTKRATKLASTTLERSIRTEVRWQIWQQLPLLIALVVLWTLLWGSLSWLNLITGILLAIAVTRVLYLPPVELSGRFNIVWFGAFLGQFLVELVIASFQVAFQAFSPRGIVQNSVVAVRLATRSDFIMTLTAIALSLIPGSIVVEADRSRGILYLHALNTETPESIDRLRDKVLGVETRLVRALGSRDDVARLRA